MHSFKSDPPRGPTTEKITTPGTAFSIPRDDDYVPAFLLESSVPRRRGRAAEPTTPKSSDSPLATSTQFVTSAESFLRTDH